MLRRTLPAFGVLALAACAHEAPAPAPSTAPAATTTAQPVAWPLCTGAGRAACCRGYEDQMRRAHAAGDEEAADEALQVLALSCPERTRGTLALWAKMIRCVHERPRPAELEVRWTIALPASDVLYWAGLYVDGKRSLFVVPPGRHALKAVFQVASRDPRQPVMAVTATAEATLGEADLRRADVSLRRTDQGLTAAIAVSRRIARMTLRSRPCPGQPDQIVAWSAWSTSDAVVGGVVGAPGSPPPPPPPPGPIPPPPLRRETPGFQPPPELLTSGPPSFWVENCFFDRRRRLVYGGPQVHPRLLGAAFDWARRIDYDERAPGPRLPCDRADLQFDPPPDAPAAP